MKKFYYTIGEVCNLLELKAHVLRYWEKEFPQIHPQKRFGRIRRYNPEDIELIKKIKYMLYVQKYTIEGVRKKLREGQKTQPQIELDFTSEKGEVRLRIKKQLAEIRQLLTGQ